jgi:ubiquinone/menaquinone biosynthesis C-methylase UbiE
MALTETKEHWEKIYDTKKPNEVSWFQKYPKTSIEFIKLFNLPKNAAIIDIGGGDSNFVDVLIDQGYTDITVLDISSNAIERAKKRLGVKSARVKWVVSDITQFNPERKYDFWHDRAAFHFLVSNELADKYVQISKRGVKENGYLILGTFSEKGPDKCSGLEVKKYSQESMSNKFVDGFKRVKCIEEEHNTPFHTTQSFLFCSFQRLKKGE